MLKLWKNCDIYAPAHLGKRDILIMGGKIWKIEADLSADCSLTPVYRLREGEETYSVYLLEPLP